MWVRLILAVAAGMILYLLLTLCTAHLILNASVPEAAAGHMQIGAVCIAAFVSGTVYGAAGGHRLVKGLAVGAIISIGILLAKGVCEQNAVWTVHTTLSVAASILFGTLGSCILHKRNKKTTKRVKRKTVRNNA